jgi:hypothetical protein
METIDALNRRIEEAGTITTVLGAGWDAFELIQQLAAQYAGHLSSLYATWMWVIAPACEGRDALGAAPSMPPGPGAGHPTPESASEEEAARMLAGLAGTLSARLQTPMTDSAAPGDLQACMRAADAAGEIRKLLSPHGT